MEQRKLFFPGWLWRVLSPVLLYYAVSFLVSSLIMQRVMVKAGYALMEAVVDQSGYTEYLMEEYMAHTMQSVLLTSLLVIPFLIRMYLKDLAKRPGSQNGRFQIVLDVPALVIGAFGSAALALFLNSLLTASPLMDWSPEYQKASQAIYSAGIWMELAASVLGASVMEELMMRGLVYRRIRELAGARPAIVSSALLFGIMHGNLVQGVYGFLMGLLLAWLMERFGTVLIPIGAHMAANLLLILMTESGAMEHLGAGGVLFFPVTALCGLSFLWAFRVLRKREVFQLH